MTVKAPTNEAFKPTVKCYDTYGQLIKMLLPRAQNIAIFEGRGGLVWANDGFNSPDLQPHVDRARKESAEGGNEVAGFSSFLDDGTPVYVFRLRDDLGELQAVVCLSCRANASGEERPFSLIHGLLAPALSCLQRELAAHSSIGALNRSLDARSQDLDMLLSASEDETGSATDELRRLVQTCANNLGAVLGAVLIPERSISVCRTPQGAATEADTDVLTRTHRHLLSLAQAQGRTMVVNKIAAGAPEVPQFKIVSVPLRHVSGRVVGILAMFRTADGADFDLKHTRLVELLARRVTAVLESNYDGLTGLLTATAFEQQTRTHLLAAKPEMAHSVVLVDLDHLDTINNDHGMHVGDEVIGKIADLLRRPLPGTTFAARIAGDQFALFLSECDAAAAATHAETLRAAVAELGRVRGDGSTPISVTCGVARVAAGSLKLAHAMACAEVACKNGKAKGRNRVEQFQESDVSDIRRTSDFTLVSLIKDAIAEDRFRLDLQTIMPLMNHASADLQFEVLLRMNDADGQSIAPAKFLAAATRSQLLPEIDRWVVTNTLRQLNSHAEILSRHPASFSINISGAALEKADFGAFVESTLADHGVSPGRILFEVSEADAAAHPAKAAAFFEKVRKLGCRVALDDFGSGSTSFAQLKDLPIDLLKIDGSLVRDVLTHERAATIIAAIAQMARALGLKSVAECVETENQRVKLAALGVDFAQGFSIGKSQPFAEVLIDLPLFEFFLNQQRAAASIQPLVASAS